MSTRSSGRRAATYTYEVRLPAFKKLAATPARQLEGILSYCRHKIPFGVIEAINANIRSVIRRGRGYRYHEYLILRVGEISTVLIVR